MAVYLSNGEEVCLNQYEVDAIRKLSRMILRRFGLSRDQVVRLANKYGVKFDDWQPSKM